MKLKILFCTINGVGLGHIARGINIAKELRRIMPCDILFATNSSFTRLFEENGFSFLTGGMGSAEVFNNKVSHQAYLEENDKFFSSVSVKFNPQILIFDLLVLPDTLLYAKKHGIFTVFVLREVNNSKYFEDFRKYLSLFDLVLLANVNDPEMTRWLSTVGFNKNKVHYVGPIFRQPEEDLIKEVKRKYKIKDDEFLVTITGGGGAGGGCFREVNYFYGFMEKLSKALDSRVKKKIRWILIRGPLTLFKPHKLRNIEVYDFEYKMPELFKLSNLVVAVGGYNSLNEVLSAQTPAVFYALPTRMDDQVRRMFLYQERGLIAELNIDDFPGSLRLFKECVSPRYARKIKTVYRSYFHKNAGRNAAALIIRNYQEYKDEAVTLGVLRLNSDVKTENFITEEVEHLSGFKPHYFCGSPKNANVDFNSHTCEPFTLTQKQGVYYPVFSDSSIKEFDEAFFSGKIKAFYAEFLSDVVSFFPFIRKHNIPLVVNFRGYELSDPKTVKHLSAISQLSRMIIARSNFQKDVLLSRGIPQDKVQVVYSGVNLDKIPFAPRITDSRVVRLLSAGRFVEKKGFDTTIDFFKIVLSSYPKATLTIIGEGELEDSVIAKIDKEGLRGCVKVKNFLPHRDFISELYRHDIFVLACKTAASGDQEGIPNVLKEAMASGMAVISTFHAGIPELIEDGVTGFLVKENSPVALYKKFEWILGNSQEIKRINLNARFFVEKNFDVKQTSRQVGAIIKQELVPEDIRSISGALAGKPPAQFRVDLHVTAGCNGKCVMCYNWKNKVSTLLSKDKIFSLFSELKSFGVNQIRFHGQEPTLRKDLYLLVAEAKKRGFKIGLKTNALLFSDNKITAKYSKVIDELYLSVDSSEEKVHTLLRRNKDSFKKNIRLAVRIKKYNPKIRIFFNAVVTRLNYQHLIGLMDLAAALKVNKVSYVLLNRKNRADIDDIQLNLAQLRDFYFRILPAILEKSKKHSIPVSIDPYFTCLLGIDLTVQINALQTQFDRFTKEIRSFSKGLYGREFYKENICFGVLDHLTIDWKGNVYPCCAMMRSQATSIGNILENKFSDIWNSEQYAAYRKQVLLGECRYKDECSRNFKQTKEANNYLIGNTHLRIWEDALDKFLSLFNYGEYLYKYQARMMANYAYSKSVLYRDKVKDNILLRDNQDFLKLPIVDRRELRGAFYAQENIPNYYGEESAVFRTSSCGENAFLYARPNDSTRFPRMAAAFLNTGFWKIGDPWMKLTALNCLETARPVSAAVGFSGYGSDKGEVLIPPYENILKVPSKQIKSVYRLVAGSGSRLFHANPSYLKLLLYRFWQDGLRLKGKYAVNSTYEVLLPSTARLIHKYLDCAIYDQYGCSEIGPVSITCKNNVSHIFSKSVYVEVIPEKASGRKDIGKVVVTDLENRVMPFVRYFTGDYAYIPKRKECSCDFRTPVLGKILGRSQEAVYYAGRAYFPLDFDGLFFNLENILMYQIIFKQDRILIKVVLEDSRLKTRLNVAEERIKQLLGSKIEPVEVEVVDYILPNSRGKYRSVVTER